MCGCGWVGGWVGGWVCDTHTHTHMYMQVYIPNTVIHTHTHTHTHTHSGTPRTAPGRHDTVCNLISMKALLRLYSGSIDVWHIWNLIDLIESNLFYRIEFDMYALMCHLYEGTRRLY